VLTFVETGVCQVVDKSDLIIFSSRSVAEAGVTNAIRKHLSTKNFTVTIWTEGFFPPSKIALYSFLKKLMCFDAAVVVLGADDVRIDPDDAGKEQHVPRDNVIFELGACMARMGNERTFVLCPDEPRVILPSYFYGIAPIPYESTRTDSNIQAAVGAACETVAQAYDNVLRNSYFSDLPAAGLAYGYFWNFVKPTYDAFNSGSPSIDCEVALDNGFEIVVLMPENPLTRDQVQKLFCGHIRELPASQNAGATPPKGRKIHFDKRKLILADGRDISIYVKSAQSLALGDSFTVYDVPTTLMTSSEIIERIDLFWTGGGGDPIFRKALGRKEGKSFSTVIERLIQKAGLPPMIIRLTTLEDFYATAFEY
jgi:hypothetical protein